MVCFIMIVLENKFTFFLRCRTRLLSTFILFTCERGLVSIHFHLLAALDAFDISAVSRAIVARADQSVITRATSFSRSSSMKGLIRRPLNP